MTTTEFKLRAVSLGGVAVFLIAVAALHLLDSSRSPDTHVISEYANGRYGWLLTAALLSWGLSLLAASAWSVRRLQPPARRAVAALLLVATAGIVTAAVFRTQAVAGAVPEGTERTLTGQLHDAGAGVATLALFVAAAVAGATERTRSSFGRISLAVVIFAVVVQASLLVVGHEVGGIRQRSLVLTACAWQAALVRTRPVARRCSRRERRRERT